jgi:hypothetical protein
LRYPLGWRAAVLFGRADTGGAGAGCGPSREVQTEAVHNVHTQGFGSGRTGAGLGRTADVFGGVASFQGLEPGSSPTSGTAYPVVRGDFALTCVQTLRWRASDANSADFGLAAARSMQVCGVAGSSPWLVGLPPAVSGFT